LPSLASFVVYLAERPHLAKIVGGDNKAAAIAVMRDFGLTDKQQADILSRSKSRISGEIQKELGPSPGLIAVNHVGDVVPVDDDI